MSCPTFQLYVAPTKNHQFQILQLHPVLSSSAQEVHRAGGNTKLNQTFISHEGTCTKI